MLGTAAWNAWALVVAGGCSPDRCLVELLLRVACMLLPGC